MRFSQCACGRKHLQSYRRNWWQKRFFATRKLYKCKSCGVWQLLPVV